jgi:hypothetical protein
VLRVKEIEVVDPSTNASGSEQTPRPSGDGNGTKPSLQLGPRPMSRPVSRPKLNAYLYVC